MDQGNPICMIYLDLRKVFFIDKVLYKRVMLELKALAIADEIYCLIENGLKDMKQSNNYLDPFWN
jgi:hypothetical protein